MRKRFTPLLLLLLSLSGTAIGQDTGKIEKELAELMASSQSEDDKIRINILLNEQYDQNQLRRIAAIPLEREAQKELVIKELKRFSRDSQTAFLQTLDTENGAQSLSNMKQLWMSNAINCEASVETICKLAENPAVRLIGYDRLDTSAFKSMSTAQAASGDNAAVTYSVEMVKAPEVWKMGYEGENVIVAILDSGVNYNHEDLKGNMWESPDPAYPNHGYDFASDDNDPMDDVGHGSHCAGIVAGNGASGTITGSAPKAKIMAVRVGGSGGITSSWIVQGMEFAVENGADLISMSIGMQGGGPETERIMLRKTLENVLNAGIAATIAVGNDGRAESQAKFPIPDNIALPGNCPPPYFDEMDESERGGNTAVIAIGSCDEFGRNRAVFSSKGPATWKNTAGYNDYPFTPGNGLIRPDLVTPGASILSLAHDSNTDYTLMSGTSMATPCAAGIVALMLSKNPTLTPEDICRILIKTTQNRPEKKDNEMGWGLADALAAVESVPEPNMPITLSSLTIREIIGNGDGKLSAGETVGLQLRMKNKSKTPYTNVAVELSTDNKDVEIRRHSATAETLNPYEDTLIEDAFEVRTNQDIEDKNVNFTVTFKHEGETKSYTKHMNIYDYQISCAGATLVSTESGEQALRIFLRNDGDGEADNIQVEGFTTDGDYKFAAPTCDYGNMHPKQYKFRDFMAEEAENAKIPQGTSISGTIAIVDSLGTKTQIPLDITVGQSEELPETCNTPIIIKHKFNGADMHLTWKLDGEAVPDGFAIYRNGELIKETTSKRFMETNLPGGHKVYQIEAYYMESGCTSAFSTHEVDIDCATPQNLQATSQDGAYIKLTWDASHETVNIYNVYRDGKLLAESVEGLSYKDTEVKNDTTYCYAVTAQCDATTESDLSAETCAKFEGTGIEDIANDTPRVYPNPSKGEVTVAGENILHVRIFDVSGSLTNEIPFTAGQKEMRIDILKAGVYLLRILRNDKTQTTEKLVITK